MLNWKSSNILRHLVSDSDTHVDSRPIIIADHGQQMWRNAYAGIQHRVSHLESDAQCTRTAQRDDNELRRPPNLLTDRHQICLDDGVGISISMENLFQIESEFQAKL